jgi:hypothetical protein
VKRAAGLLVLALLAVGVGVGEALTPPTDHVLLVGDSIMRQTGGAMARQLGDGWTVHNEGVNGSGLLTPAFFDWDAQLAESLARTDPDVVVFLFIGNYTADPAQFWQTAQGREVRDTGSAAFAREWGRQADEAMAMIAETGAEVVLVLPPPMPTDDLQAVVDHLRAEYEGLAQRWPFIRLVDATTALGGPGGEWVGHMETVGGDLLPVRTGDAVHLAPHGQRLLAREIVPAVREAAGQAG